MKAEDTRSRWPGPPPAPQPGQPERAPAPGMSQLHGRMSLQERLTGTLWAEARSGQGASFFFTLSESAPPPWPAGANPAPPSLGTQAGTKR